MLSAPLVELVEDVVPASRLLPVQPHDTLELDGLELTVVPAIHGLTMEDAYGDGSEVGGRPRFVGYVLGGERRVYHAGDTIVTNEVRLALEPLGIAVALLPINGRDPEREARGIVGNMDAIGSGRPRARDRRATARPNPLGRVRGKHRAARVRRGRAPAAASTCAFPCASKRSTSTPREGQRAWSCA